MSLLCQAFALVLHTIYCRKSNTSDSSSRLDQNRENLAAFGKGGRARTVTLKRFGGRTPFRKRSTQEKRFTFRRDGLEQGKVRLLIVTVPMVTLTASGRFGFIKWSRDRYNDEDWQRNVGTASRLRFPPGLEWRAMNRKAARMRMMIRKMSHPNLR